MKFKIYKITKVQIKFIFLKKVPICIYHILWFEIPNLKFTKKYQPAKKLKLIGKNLHYQFHQWNFWFQKQTILPRESKELE